MSLNLPKATKVSQKQRSCQTEQTWPTGKVPSELGPGVHVAGMLGDASQMCSAHRVSNSTPLRLHQRSLPYMVYV